MAPELAKDRPDPSEHSRQHHRRLLMKTLVFLVLMALLGPLSNILFRVGMERMGALSSYAPSALLLYGWRMLGNGFLVGGTIMRILFTVASFLVLSWADYSFVTPASAVNYAIVALMGAFWLGESVSPERWIGIGIICLGVALVGLTPASTTRAEAPPGVSVRGIKCPNVHQEDTELC